MTEQDIINLNNYWYLNDHEWLGKKHKTNNPWHYVKEPNYATNEHRKQRLNDLNVLLELIYEKYLQSKDSLLLTKFTDVELQRFQRYIYREIIYNFPYKCFQKFTIEDLNITKNLPGYTDWMENVLKFKTDINTGRNAYINNIDLLKLRREIILQHFVAEIAHFINKLQVDDIENRMKTNNMIYGERHALSAFLGQHIIRLFPFKEGIQFRSKSFVNDNPAEAVKEHWTPISFFRDLIWINQPNSSSPKVFSVDEWFKILKYAYRIVMVSDEEDGKLTSNGFKSKRPFSAYGNKSINIAICEQDILLWDELHRI
jgi:hypothetical protein